MSGRRYLLYCHDAVGLGHVRRTITLANKLVTDDPTANVLVATGCESLELFSIEPRVDILRLPSIRKNAEGEYVSRRLNVTKWEIISLRSELLSASVKGFRPDVLLVDKHAAGAGGELSSSIFRTKAQGGRLALGFRDVLDEPGAVQREWEKSNFRGTMAHYDEILVYGDPRIVNHRVAYGLRPSIDPPVNYCGYVTGNGVAENSPELARTRPGPRVLATAGGGEDGYQLLETALAATAGTDWDVHLVLGPMASGSGFGLLQSEAQAAGIRVHKQIPHLGSQFRSFDALVTMGGYNTLVEAVSSGVPTVCVPRVQPRTEQLIRATAFSRLGLIDAIHPGDLSPAHLRERIGRALSEEPAGEQADTPLDVNGAQHASQALSRLASLAGTAISPTGTGGTP